jgi:hypothetical protein
VLRGNIRASEAQVPFGHIKSAMPQDALKAYYVAPDRRYCVAKKCRNVCGEQRASVMLASRPHFCTS